jgi:hypothetical protein
MVPGVSDSDLPPTVSMGSVGNPKPCATAECRVSLIELAGASLSARNVTASASRSPIGIQQCRLPLVSLNHSAAHHETEDKSRQPYCGQAAVKPKGPGIERR